MTICRSEHKYSNLVLIAHMIDHALKNNQFRLIVFLFTWQQSQIEPCNHLFWFRCCCCVFRYVVIELVCSQAYHILVDHPIYGIALNLTSILGLSETHFSIGLHRLHDNCPAIPHTHTHNVHKIDMTTRTGEGAH